MPSRVANESQRDRKRKNADAQAQFRQRRANYISSLEETVTKLESVVVELQDCLRDAKQETVRVNDEKQQILSLFHHLRQELSGREQAWKEAWTKQLPEAPLPVSSPTSIDGSRSPLLSPSISSCLDPSLPTGYQDNSPQPAISRDCDPRGFNSIQNSPEDKLSRLNTSCKKDGPFDEGKMSICIQPSWVNLERVQVSPKLHSRKGDEEMLLCDPHTIPSSGSQIKLPSKRKATPESPRSRHSSSSSSISNLPETADHRPSKIHLSAYTLPNLGDISEGGMRDELEDMHDMHLPSMTPNSPTNGYGFSDISNDLSQRSGSPPISNTLAVIKATAFGALRRNRTQRKRGDSHATKVALEALEARGLGLGLQPTMTLSSVHGLPVDDSIEEAKRHAMSVDNVFPEED